TDEPQPTEALDISAYIQGEDIVTRNGQLRWREGARARVVIDTSATQAVIGRSAGETVTCAQVTFTPTTPWCYLAVTAIDRDGDLATGKRLLITALARARNTGMRFAGDELIEAGKAPVLMEPVVADLRLLRA